MVIGRASDYKRAKKLLWVGNHPTYVGPNMLKRHARNGGLLIFQVDDKDAAVAVVNPRLNVILVLNVHPNHRGHGLGSAIMRFLRPSWVRSISEFVQWFERQGYVVVSDPKQGRRYETRLMVRQELLTLAGRIAKLYEETLKEKQTDGTQGA